MLVIERVIKDDKCLYESPQVSILDLATDQALLLSVELLDEQYQSQMLSQVSILLRIEGPIRFLQPGACAEFSDGKPDADQLVQQRLHICDCVNQANVLRPCALPRRWSRRRRHGAAGNSPSFTVEMVGPGRGVIAGTYMR